MPDLAKLQKKIFKNKVAKGFNITDVPLEFCLIHGEVSEAFEAWRKNKPDVGEELADVVIYLLGLAEILRVDLEREILAKVGKNGRRVYKKINGVTTKTKEG